MERKTPTMQDLRKVPTDEIVETTIIEVTLQTWRDKVKDIEKTKFKEEDYDKEIVTVKFDYDGFIRDETYYFSENPTTTSQLGRYMVKYDKFPEVGDKIKVFFDQDGKTKVVVAK